MAPQNPCSRRQFVKDAGGLLIGFSLGNPATFPRMIGIPSPPETVHTPPAASLDSWLRIERDETIRVFTGKTDIGMGVQTALIQIVAEELDVAPQSVSFVMGDTGTTVDQGGVGGSTSVMLGSKPLRNAAATARFLLLRLASSRFDVPVEQLQVKNGIVSVRGDAGKSVAYGILVAESELKDELTVSGQGFGLNVEGLGSPKAPAVDETSIKSIPGLIRIVVRGNFVGVVAESEWSAVRVAEALKITWTKPAPAFPKQNELYRYMRITPAKASKGGTTSGDAVTALAGATQLVEATYEWPFQSHATMGPGCAVADVRLDGVTTIWSGCQKPHALRKGIADLLKLPVDAVQVNWVEDAGSYGRPGFEDTAADAAVLSQSIGKPVRVQWMRSDMSGWGTKGPAVTCDLCAGLDAHGRVTGFEFTSRAFSGGETFYHPDTAGNFLAAQLMGVPNTTGKDEFAEFGEHSASYKFPNIRAIAHVVPALYPSASPLRTTHLRDPEGPAVTFAVESFLDEVAAATRVDPIDFRIAYLDDPRAKAALASVAERASWDRRPSPKSNSGTGDIVTGRGIAFGTRRGTYVATVAEVEVNRRTGTVWVRRLVCAHDCGLIVNPDGLRGTIEANLIQSMSRSLKEEVTFNRENVTSVDWQTYPVARSLDIPEQVDIVLLNHPELPAAGAGEPASRPTAASIANAIFDATGARVRQAPLTPSRVKAALVRISSE